MVSIKTKPGTFEDRLKQLCNNSGKMMIDIEEESGISVGSWHYYITGERQPYMLTVIKICEYFGCSADWLLMGKDNVHMAAEQKFLVTMEER